MAAQLMVTGKAVLYEGFKELLLPYLDISPLMPPVRLQYSKLLGRPLMDPAYQHQIAVSVFVEEMLPHPDAVLTGHQEEFDPTPWRVDELAPSIRTRDAFYWVYLRADGDRDFADDWKARYGHDWPFVADGRPHPALANLYLRHRDFWSYWCNHGEAANIALDMPDEDTMQAYRNRLRFELEHGATLPPLALAFLEEETGEDEDMGESRDEDMGESGDEDMEESEDRPFEGLARHRR